MNNSNKPKMRKKQKSDRKSIVDIARLTSVSTATISRYFSKPSILTSSMRERIRQVVEREGYVPTLETPRSGAKNSTKVAYLLNNSSKINDYFKSLMQGFLISANIYEFDVLSYFSPNNAKDSETQNNWERNRAIQNRVLAIILTEERNKDFLDFCKINKIRLVYIIEKKMLNKMSFTEDDYILVIDKLEENNVQWAGLFAISLLNKIKNNEKTSKKYLLGNNTYKALD